MDSPKGWTKQGNRAWRSQEWSPKADTSLSLLNPPRRAEAKKGGELCEAKRRGEFLLERKPILRSGGWRVVECPVLRTCASEAGVKQVLSGKPFLSKKGLVREN